jgi:hypothetical protein
LGGLAAVFLVLPAYAGAKDESYPANYKTQVRQLKPPVSGLKLEATGGDRYLRLTNGSGKMVLVKGYDDDPYLRFQPNRVVEVNIHSPSKYVNEDRFGTLQPPASAVPGATPKWKVVSTNGTYQWFDHRIHWMERTLPPAVKDRDKRTKIFDWNVSMSVAGRPVQALGTLTWIPDSSSGSSTLLIVAIVAAALLALAIAFILLRRRGRAPKPAREHAAKEAW